MHKLLRCLLGCVLGVIFLMPDVTLEAKESTFAEMLTEQERDFLMKNQQITVAFSPNKGPIQYMDSSGKQKGISKDVLEEVSAFTGLQFSFITLPNMKEMQKGINSGQVQILAGIPMEEEVQEAYAVNFSLPYLNCDYGVLLPRGGNLDNPEDLRLALTVGLDIPKEFHNTKAVLRFNTIQECIQAVNDRQADFTYGNGYVLEFYSQGYRYQNLSVVPFSGKNQQLCFGVSNNADPCLLSILDKYISHRGPDPFINTIIRNVAVSTQTETVASWISLNPKVSVAIGFLILVLISLLTFLILIGNRRKAMLLRMEHQRYLLLSEVSQEYFYEYNFQTDCLSLNPETAQLFGTKEVIKKWSSLLKETDKLDPGSQKMLEQLYAVCQEKEQPNAATISRGIDIKLPTATGKKRWFRLTRATLYRQNRPAYSIGKLIDIEDEYNTYHDLIQKSVSDGLTGLYNGVAAGKMVDRAIQNLREGVLFMLDLDFFKQVNDQCGHQTGDRVIQELAEILKQTFRKDDILGRVGGDEFVVFVANTANRSFIDKKCRELQEKVGKIQVGNGLVQSISIGVSIMEPPCQYEQLFQQADAALYFVKNNGRAGYYIFQ